MYPNYMNKPSFMTNTSNTTFGAPTSSFGQPAANAPMFSSMQPSNIFQTPSTSSFNAGSSAQTTFGSNLFGQQQQTSTNGMFGSTNTFGTNKPTFGFGSSPSQTGLFGQQPQQPTGTSLFQSNSSNLFGGTNAFGTQGHTGTVIKFSPVTGTDTMQKNGVTQSISTKHHCITCMKEYENKSLEELRFEDYTCNRKGPQQQTGFSSAPFGANTAGASTSLFGQTDNKQGFGQTTSFGQTSTFGQTAPGFGVTNPTNTPSLFGKSSFGATTTTSTFGFNPTPSTSNPFSPSQAPKPFPQPLFGANTTQPQTGFGTNVFGQTNTQNTTSNLFQKPAQPTTGFNTGQSTGFPFNQTTQPSNLFNASKPSTGFGIFGQTNTGTTAFGQTSQPTFGTNFGKLTTTTFTQPIQPTFGTTLGAGMQQPSMFTNTASKPNNLFGNTNTGSGLFNNNVFQATPTSFSLNINQQQPMLQFPPEPSDESKNIALIATDSFPDGPHVYGLEPVLNDISHSTTNPQDIKAMLDYSRKRDELLGTRAKIKVHMPKPKRNSNFIKEFFPTTQNLKTSPKCLSIKKFNDNFSTIYNKYNNELIEEADDFLNGRTKVNDDECSLLTSSTSPRSDTDSYNTKLERELEERKRLIQINLDRAAYSDETTDDTKSNESFAFSDALNFDHLTSSPVANFNQVTTKCSLTRLPVEEVSVVENESESPPSEPVSPNVSLNGFENIENPAGVTLTKAEYYMYPSLQDLSQYTDENGECIIQGLTIGRRGYGNVYFPDPIDIANMNFDEIVHFHHREVIVYPDDAKKPPVGEGLNRRAQVTLDKIYPREKGTNKYIKDMDKIAQSNFIDNLIHVTQKHNCKFVDYRPKSGSWVFKVKHFSKYAFTDSDEEECELGSDKMKRKQISQLLIEFDETTKQGLGGHQVALTDETLPKTSSDSSPKVASENGSMTLDYDDFLPDQPFMPEWSSDQLIITENISHYKSTIQNIKAAIFADVTNEKHSAPKKRTKPQLQVPFEYIDTTSSPTLKRAPKSDLVAVPKKVTRSQKCYMDFGVFENNSYKLGWMQGFQYLNYHSRGDLKVVYSITPSKIKTLRDTEYNTMLPNLKSMLFIALKFSDCVFDADQVPTFKIKKNKGYLEDQTALFRNYVQQKHLHGKSTYLCSVWDLCSLLWGRGPNQPPEETRELLSEWLKTTSCQMSNDWKVNESSYLHENDTFKEVFKLLSFYKIQEACNFAVKHKLPQLSTMISQLSANQRFKCWIKKSLENFAWKEKDVVLENFRKVYMLLAGIAKDDPVNVCENMEWMRAFGIHLWYGAPSASSVRTAFAMYKKAFEQLGYATKPIPHYGRSELEGDNYDLLYHILAVYCEPTYQLCNVLHPETHTRDILDYRFSWILMQVFLSLEVGLIRETEQDHMHVTFSNQLEDMGEWLWSIFPLLYLSNSDLKKILITRILERHLSMFTGTVREEKELVNIFSIPPSWIYEVKATKARAFGYNYDLFQYNYYMNDWHEVNSSFVNSILPDLFIHDEFRYVRTLLKWLGPESKKVCYTWSTQAGIFEDFIELNDFIHRRNVDEVKYIAGKLSSLFKRLKCLPYKSDCQRLCVAELSKQCALLLTMIHKALDRDTLRAKFLNVLNEVRMPQDNKYYEMFETVSHFLTEEELVAIFPKDFEGVKQFL